MKPRLVVALLLLFFVVCACAQTPSGSCAGFKDRTAELGLDLANSAACWVDVDNDGWIDIICGGIYWRNNTGRGFVRMQDGLGSVVAADYDNDGFTDMFSYSERKLFHNEGGKKLVEITLPVLPKTVSRGACWGDLNGDGFVDLYVGGFEDWDAEITYPSMILINFGGKSFEMTWSDAVYRTRGVTACDFNRDGNLDIYVSNYRLQPSVLLLNEGAGRLTIVSAEYNALATSAGFAGGHSIGAAWGDFNNDGLMDLFAGNFAHVDNRGDQPKSRFLKNLGSEGKYHFEDMGTCGVFYQESYASPAASDYDNDGNLDLMFTTVYPIASFDKTNHAVLFHNEGNFVFSDATAPANMAGLPATYQAAWADFNHDGNLDLVCGGKLFLNQGGTGNHWVEIRLRGDGREVNRSAIGAQVRIRLKDNTLTRQVEAGTGEGNQNDLTLHFGLGKLAVPVTLEILWPNGKTQTVRNVDVDCILEVRDAQNPEGVISTVSARLFGDAQ